MPGYTGGEGDTSPYVHINGPFKIDHWQAGGDVYTLISLSEKARLECRIKGLEDLVKELKKEVKYPESKKLMKKRRIAAGMISEYIRTLDDLTSGIASLETRFSNSQKIVENAITEIIELKKERDNEHELFAKYFDIAKKQEGEIAALKWVIETIETQKKN